MSIPNGTVRCTAAGTRVAGLADTHGALGGLDGDLDAPPGGVPGDDLLGVCGAVGGEHQQFPGPVAGGVTHGDEPSGAFAECAVPQAGDLGDAYGVGTAVAGH